MISINDISTEFIASAATGILLLTAKYPLQKWKNYKIRKKHPLAGKYISYYDDFREDGTTFKRKAHLQINQNGDSFTAKNRNLDDGREWDLRGSILTRGYLAGTYGRLDPSDASKGTFFMEPSVSHTGTYNGHWSGYDSVNRKLFSAEYSWRRLQKVRIRHLTKKDSKLVDSIVAIFAEALGNRFISKEKITEILSGNSDKFILGAFVGKHLVAVRTAYILSETECTSFEKECQGAGRPLDLKNYKVGMLASNAVRKSYRRKGIGSQMVESGLKFLEKKGCTMCISTAWKSESIESSAKILETFGFEHITTSKNHWKTDSLTADYECPRCGSPPCSCSAHFYKKQTKYK